MVASGLRWILKLPRSMLHCVSGPIKSHVTKQGCEFNKQQGRSQAIFGGMHKAIPKLSQGKGNITTVIITITVKKPFYYFYGILVHK